MDFAVVTLLFCLFCLGLGMLVQGIIGGEPTLKHQYMPFGQILETKVEHPPTRHRLRLALIGIALMISAVMLAIVFL